jgi:hypothetical protein
MSAQPIEEHDPRDPEVILRSLPERERDEFLRQYHEAVDAAHDPAGYKEFQKVLQTWSLAVVATNKPGYYEALEDAKNGVGEYVSWDDVVAKFDSTL